MQKRLTLGSKPIGRSGVAPLGTDNTLKISIKARIMGTCLLYEVYIHRPFDEDLVGRPALARLIC